MMSGAKRLTIMHSTTKRSPVALILTWLAVSPFASAQSLDFEFYRTHVEPIFVQKRAGHARCVVCHSSGSGSAFHLQPLAPGADSYTEEQSRKNFDVVSRLVVPGEPSSSILLMHPLAPEAGGDYFHGGGRQFSSKQDPAWQTIAEWVNGK
jgi:hypothetical protein